MTADELELLTGIISGAIYLIIFAFLLMIGYGARASSIYNKVSDHLPDSIAAYAWYPLLYLLPMARAAGLKSRYAIGVNGAFYAGILMSVIMLIAKSSFAWVAITVTVMLWLASNICHCYVLKRYMEKYSPQTSLFAVIVSSFLPLFKLFIHIDF